MAISNTEKQSRFYASKIAAGESKISCWLTKEDQQRLSRLMKNLGEERGSKAGYADVIGEALKMLEIAMAPPGTKNMVRYGLLYLNNEGENERR